MNENLADEIRKTIESIKDMKIQASGINNYLSIMEGMMRADIQKKVDEAYKRGVEDGRNETWDCAKEIILHPDNGGMTSAEILAAFGEASAINVLYKYSAQQAIEKMKAYEEQKADDEIKVGDEVVNKTTGKKGILLEPETQYLLATVIIPSQRWGTFYASHKNLKKTGKHYDIEKILEEMRQ